MLRTMTVEALDLALVELAAKLEQARQPEDVFGFLDGSPSEQMLEARRAYRQMARVCHPDAASDGAKEIAAKAFQRLSALWERAQQQIFAGVYGTPGGAAVGLKITGKRHRYTLERLLAVGEVADVYHCRIDNSEPGIFKLARKPAGAALLQAEARHLRQVVSTAKDAYVAYFPSLIESVRVRGHGGVHRLANVLSTASGLFSIEEVVSTYRANGRLIEPKDMAWIWRRLLTALGVSHQAGIIHGAVLPPHVLIHAEQHGVVLVGWGTSKQTGETQRTVSRAYRDWYPREVFEHEPVSAETDIALAARTMVYLLGGNPVAGTLPPATPSSLRSFFKACMLPKQNMRPDDAWALKETFDDLIERLWGPRHFRPFYMPRR